MLKKYKITGIGENDAYFDVEEKLIGREILANSNDVGIFYRGALSGEIVFNINVENIYDVWGGVDSCFHEAYVEEI